MSFGAFLRGFILGAIIGGVTGVLLAPQPGEELQDSIRQRLNDVMAEGRQAAAERRAELEAQFASAKQSPLQA